MRRATCGLSAIADHFPISIHALHEESDISGCNVSGEMPAISIHALHEESDLPHTTSRPLMRYFNPRSP